MGGITGALAAIYGIFGTLTTCQVVATSMCGATCCGLCCSPCVLLGEDTPLMGPVRPRIRNELN